jgi:hypothetical protein
MIHIVMAHLLTSIISNMIFIVINLHEDVHGRAHPTEHDMGLRSKK